MILDALESVDRYSVLHPAFPQAFEFLRNTHLEGFTSGHRNIVEDKMYAIATMAPGVGLPNARLESHRKYIDIQYSVAGIDNIGWRPTHKCQGPENDYDADKDVIFFSEIPDAWFELVPGVCALFFPEDAHAPLAVNGMLHKIVIKVAVDWYV